MKIRRRFKLDAPDFEESVFSKLSDEPKIHIYAYN